MFNPDTLDALCGACVYEVEQLDLSEFGLPGLSFTGELHVEPDPHTGCEDWYISEATTTVAGRTHAYAGKSAVFQAILKAVRDNDFLCSDILYVSREHA